jgi:hypothetical protein
MIERLVASKNSYTVYAGESTLHSRYNPVLEAENYIASLDLEKPYHYFILIEPGLGYLAAALQKRFPRSKIISLHCSAFYANPEISSLEKTGLASWNPASPKKLEAFLEELITGTQASGIKLINWRPSVNAYGKSCAELAGRTVECVRRITANRITVRNFGRRWIQNGLRNLELLKNPHDVVLRGTMPVLICAAGPGLEDSLEEIAQWKASSVPPFIIAVSSSVSALLHRGIIPDLVIATDGGTWALFHLVECCRNFSAGTRSPILAAGFTAALPSQMETWPVLILCDGSIWQELLLRSFHIPFLAFPQRGTVSASALDLALSLSSGTIYFAGLDFSHRDLKTHVFPHAFEKIMAFSSFRLKPVYSQAFEREKAIRASGSNGIYATWFKTYLCTFPQRIFSLGSSEEPGIPRISVSEALHNSVHSIVPKISTASGILPVSSKDSISLLVKALSSSLIKKQLSKELGELLIPDISPENGIFSDAVRNAVLDLS